MAIGWNADDYFLPGHSFLHPMMCSPISIQQREVSFVCWTIKQRGIQTGPWRISCVEVEIISHKIHPIHISRKEGDHLLVSK